MNNRFIKKLTTRQVEGLINFVFQNFEPGIVTYRNDKQSVFNVYYDLAESTDTVIIDDFEGFKDADGPISSCM